MTPCSLVNGCRLFRGTSCLQSWRWWAMCYFETSVLFYEVHGVISQNAFTALRTSELVKSYSEDCRNRFLWNVSVFIPEDLKLRCDRSVRTCFVLLSRNGSGAISPHFDSLVHVATSRPAHATLKRHALCWSCCQCSLPHLLIPSSAGSAYLNRMLMAAFTLWIDTCIQLESHLNPLETKYKPLDRTSVALCCRQVPGCADQFLVSFLSKSAGNYGGNCLGDSSVTRRWRSLRCQSVLVSCSCLQI